MRSIFLIFEKQNETSVNYFLDCYCDESFLNRVNDKQWNVLKNGDGMFYIYGISVDSLFREMEDKTYFSRLDGLTKPLCCWQVDISGRHDGTLEIKELIETLFISLDGFVQDDYTNYFWTIDEIKRGMLVEGHKFFDYKSAE